MNKTHMIMLALGIAGCVAMMLMMGHLLQLKPDVRATGPLAEQFSARFGSRLEKQPFLTIRERKPDEDAGVKGGYEIIAKVRPKPTTDVDRLVVDMGSFLWRQKLEQGPVRSVLIRWRDPKTGKTSRIRLNRPGARPVLRLYGPGDK